MKTAKPFYVNIVKINTGIKTRKLIYSTVTFATLERRQDSLLHEDSGSFTFVVIL